LDNKSNLIATLKIASNGAINFDISAI